MSGAGRKHRAKHLTQEFLEDDWQGLSAGERLAVCVDAPQGKTVLVEYCADASGPPPSQGVPAERGTVQLRGRFFKVIWLMRGDTVVVRDGEVVRKLTAAQCAGHLEKTAKPAEVGATEKTDVAVAKQDDSDGEDESPLLQNPNHSHRPTHVIGTAEDEDASDG